VAFSFWFRRGIIWTGADWGFGSRAQGFRKYLSVAKDHDELLAFLLGQLVREKVRAHQLRTGQGPVKVAVKIEELDDRVRIAVSPV